MDNVPLLILKDNPPTETQYSIEDIKQGTIVKTEREEVTEYNVNPIIYTTRLENMNILNEELGGYTAVYVNDRILAESKPKFRGLPVTHVSSTNKLSVYECRIRQTAYYDMTYKMREVYRKCRFKTYGSHKNVKIASSDSFSAAINPSDASQDRILSALSSHVEDQIPLNEIHTSVKNKENKLHKKYLPSKHKKLSQELKLTKRSRQLLKRCKPLSIVLEDFQTLISGTLPLNNIRGFHLVSSKNDEEYIIKNQIKNPQQQEQSSCPKINHMQKRHQKAIIKPPIKKIKFINVAHPDNILASLLKDSRTGKYEIYFSLKNNTLGYYKLEDYNERLEEYSAIPFKFRRTICCWYYREALIKNIFYEHAHFMMEVHRCDFNHCVCCCKHLNEVHMYDLYTQKTSLTKIALKEDKEIEELEYQISNAIGQIKRNIINNYHIKLQDLSHEITRNISHKGLIYKALVFNIPKVYIAPRSFFQNKYGDLSFKIIRMVNMATKKIEYYEIGADGEIILQFEVDPLKNKSACKDLEQYLFGNTIICCWYKRESYISSLKVSCTLSASALSFMRKPHSCSSENCCCCCKPKRDNRPSNSLLDIDLPRRAGQSCNFIKMEQQKKRLTNLIKNTLTCQRLKRAYKNRNAEKKINESKGVTIISSNKEDADGTAETIVQDEASGASNASEVNPLIRSILEKFKNIRLTIGKNKTVSAALEKPATELTSEELKVLAKILNIAQRYATSLCSIPDATIKNVIDMETSRKTVASFNATLIKCLSLGLNMTINNKAVNKETPGKDFNIENQQDPPLTPKVPTKYPGDPNKSLQTTKEKSKYPHNFINVAKQVKMKIKRGPKIDSSTCKIFSNIQCNKFQCYQYSFINVMFKRHEKNEINKPKISNVFSLTNQLNVEAAIATCSSGDKIDESFSSHVPKTHDVPINSASSNSEPKKTMKRTVKKNYTSSKPTVKKPRSTLTSSPVTSSNNAENVQVVDLTEDL